MSRRRTHIRVGFVGTVVVLLGIVVAEYQNLTLPVLAGAIRLYQFAVGTGLALICGWVGAQLPDWVEPAHTPHHRGFWHSRALGGTLLVLSALLLGGFVLGEPRLAVFLVRTAVLFASVGYLTHLGLDMLSHYGLPQLRNLSKGIKGTTGFPYSTLKPLVCIGLGVLSVGVGKAFLLFFKRLASRGEVWQPLLLGLAGGVFFDHSVLRGRARGLHTFVHEAAHAMVALLLGRRVTRFVATRKEGGDVQYRGRFGGEVVSKVIALAPYFWPTFAVVGVILRPLIATKWFPEFDLLLGATVGFHASTSLRDLKRNSHRGNVRQGTSSRPAETDIAKSGGLLISGMYIALATLTIYGLLISMTVSGYAGVLRWGRAVMEGGMLAVEVFRKEVAEMIQNFT